MDAASALDPGGELQSCKTKTDVECNSPIQNTVSEQIQSNQYQINENSNVIQDLAQNLLPFILCAFGTQAVLPRCPIISLRNSRIVCSFWSQGSRTFWLYASTFCSSCLGARLGVLFYLVNSMFRILILIFIVF